MNKSIKYLRIFIMACSMPFVMHLVYDIILGKQIEYTNYCSEIYSFNVAIFAYFFINTINAKYVVRKLENRLLSLILNVMTSTSIYLFLACEQDDLKLKRIAFILLTVLALINVIMALLFTKGSRENDDDDDEHYFENRYEKYSENRYERYLLERIDEKLNSIKNSKGEKSEEEIKEIINPEELLNGSDILAEMLKNHIEIQEYFQISKNQSKFSFYFSISSSVVGIIVVIIAASGMVIFKNLGISIIAAVSGAITEIISGIVLWIHNKSALQLNYYYDSLHENEKFLSAVNIADKLSEEKKEDMYIEIIRKQIDIQSKDKMNKASDTDMK